MEAEDLGAKEVGASFPFIESEDGDCRGVALGFILSISPLPRSRGPGVLTLFLVSALGGQFPREVLQPSALLPGSKPTSGAAQSELNAQVCLCPWTMSFPLPLELFFASNGFNASLFKAQASLGAFEPISAVVNAVETPEATRVVCCLFDVLTQYVCSYLLWGPQLLLFP